MSTQTLINGRYRVIKKLGEGGMGAVLLVEDLLRDGQKLALKKVLSKKGKTSILEILRHEFEMLTKLRHPNIAQAFDYGIIQGTQENFFTTEYIEGIDFYKGTEGLSIEETIELVVQCCRGLDYVHSRGLVHQDIKPDNILITFPKGESSKKSLVKIIDFGLIDRENYVQGAVRGTPQFIAPEKLKGEPVDRRSDLYSLGILLFFIFTRRLPFFAKSNKALILKHLYEDPPKPRKFRPDLPEGLEKIILKLLSKDPADRFFTAADIIYALGEVFHKSFPVDTEEAVESYILSGKFVGREKEFEYLKKAFLEIFARLVKLWEEQTKKDEVEELDAKLLGRPSKEENKEEEKEDLSSLVRTPKFIILEGEMGSGKSRLLREFKYYSQLQGANFISVELSQSSSQAALSEILKNTLPLTPPSLLDNPEYVEEFAKFLPDQFSCSSHRELTPAEEEIRTVNRIGQYLLELARKVPLVLSLDGLQWIDQTAWKTLLYLASQLQMMSEKGERVELLLLGSVREEDLSSPFLEEFFQEKPPAHIRRLPLPPLSQEAMVEHIQSIFGTSDIPKTLVEELVEEAKGNPLYLEELLKSLVESKAITRKRGKWVFPKTLAGLSIPSTLADLVSRRIERLPDEAKSILSLLSLFPQGADPDILARSLKKDIREILEVLHSLEQKQIVQKWIEEDNVIYRFSQPQMRETLYQRLPKEQREKLHLLVAETLENLYGEEKEKHLQELAYHYLKAGDRTKGLQYGFPAASELQKAYAYRAALELYQEIFRLLGFEDVKRRTQVLLTMASLHEFLGQYEEGIQKLDQVLKKVRLNKLLRVQLRRKIAHLYLSKGDVERALSLLESTLEEIRNPGAPERALCLEARARVCLKLGEMEKAKQDLQEAFEILSHQKKDRELLGVLNSRGILEFSLGNWKEAEENFLQCLKLCEQQDNLQGQGAALTNLAFLCLEQSQFEQGEKYLEKAKQLFGKIDDRKGLVLSQWLQGELLYHKGDWKQGREIAEEAFQLSEHMGDPLLLSRTYYLLGLYRFEEARFSEQMEHLERAKRLAEKARDLRMQILSHLRLGELFTYIGDLNKAKELLHTATSLAKRHRFAYLEVQTWKGQMVFFAKANLGGEVIQRAFQKAREICEAKQFQKEIPLLLLSLGKAYFWSKNYTQAFELFQSQKEFFEGSSSRKWQGEFYYLLGSSALAAGRLDLALFSLKKAFDILREIGCERLLVDTLLLLGEGYKQKGNGELGVKFQKTAKKMLEKQIQSLDPSWQKSFLMTKKSLVRG